MAVTSHATESASPWIDLLEPPIRVAGSGSVRLASFRQPPQRVPEHATSMHVLCINMGRSTRLEQCVDGQTSGGLSRYGHMTFYPAGVRQSFRWQDPADFLHVYVDTLRFREAAVDVLDTSAEPRVPTSMAGDRLLIELASSLIDVGSVRDDRPSPYFECLSSALITHVASRHVGPRRPDASTCSERPPGGALTTRQREKVIEHIERHLHERLTVRELASLVHYSASRFSCLFGAAMGMAPHRYVISRRVIRAEKLLITGSLPIARVAEASGFSSQNHLARHFRRRFGISPGAYRRLRSIRAIDR